MTHRSTPLPLLGILVACSLLIVGCGNSNSGSGLSLRDNADTLEPTDPVDPAPTEPPVITTATDWSAAMGTLALETTISNVTATRMRLYPRGIDGDCVETDDSAPFSFTIDIADFTPGDYEMLIHAAPGNFITVDFVDIGDAVLAVKTLNDIGGF